MSTVTDVRKARKSKAPLHRPLDGKDGRAGLAFERRYTTAGVDPFDAIHWEQRDASISSEKGESVFLQKDVEVPDFWSAMATSVVVSKYFRGPLGTPQRETSVRQVIGRVVRCIAEWGSKGGYFATEEDLQTFSDELQHLLLHQMMSFNSPVWFNVGIEEHPQCSACFILSIKDDMQSIMNRATAEAMLFKYGSGSGINFSAIRSSKELLAGGGTASGPVSFMKGFDAFAGVIKSGGKTRRAAKMVILNADHPDVREFVWCKAKEEKKAWALVDAGYEARLDGEAYASIFFQNSNNSVRVTDEFMHAVEDDREWSLRAVKDGRPMETVRARDLWREIADAAWQCGDPGLQYDTTINRWHTCKATDRINASNPCSEYMFLDDTACNLASLNLMKFVAADGEFDVESFRHAVDVTITAQEILVDNARYPTPEIEKNSYAFRPLGLGYANLGALLMSRGLPYDSDPGRSMAAAITALMHGEAFAQSARIAKRTGPFSGYAANQVPMLEVLRMHRDACLRVDGALAPTAILQAARRSYDDAVSVGQVHGIRNSQVTVLAPTGTIAFMMDCDTTGIEPDIALVKFKKLVGGGMLKIVNHTVPRALARLGYDAATIDDIVGHVETRGTIEGAPGLLGEHLPVFDCAFKPQNGVRTIAPMGHVKMMSAVQPFLSGAISKTVNMPADATVEDVEKIYFDGWKLGLKAVAIYRDGCKRSQPLSTSDKADTKDSGRDSTPPMAAAEAKARGLNRRRLSDERASVTHKFSIGGHEGYVTVGLYDDGTPGEIFVRMAKEGSTVSGLMDSFATMTSIALQYGVPLRILIDKFSHSRFEPSGWTQNPEIPIAKSITDYLFRWLSLKFLKEEAVSVEATDAAIDPPKLEAASRAALAHGNGNGHAHVAQYERSVFVSQADAPACHECGSIMVRSGSCYRCLNCAATSGCS